MSNPGRSVTDCLDDEAVWAFVDGRVDPDTGARIKGHIDVCEGCRVLVAETARSRFAIPTDDDPPLDPLAGIRDRYSIERVIGAGGMGVVYAAHDMTLGRPVALKLLLPDVSRINDGGRALLLAEAQTMARLSHPNLITVYDVGATGDHVFIAMELSGANLRTWLAAGRGWREVLAVLVGAGRGLAAAHQVGVIHRDVKPENLLVGDDGRARVTDFGLACNTETSATPTGGTLAYMAPEQMRGEAAQAAADQFSFCVVAFEALFGQHPFPVADRQAAVLAGGSLPAPERRGIPAPIGSILARGLRSRPGERHGSMTELVDQLARAGRVRRLRTGWVLAAVGFAIAAAVAGAAGAGIFGSRADRTDPCAGSSARIDPIWSVERQRVIRTAFFATGAAYAGDAWEHTRSRLDDYARGWARAARGACGDRSRAPGDHQALARRDDCLDQRLSDFDELLRILASADRDLVSRATSATGSLAPIELCDDPRSSPLATLAAPSPQDHARVEQLRKDLARGALLAESGRYADANALAAELSASARELAYQPLLAEALYLLGRTDGLLGKQDAAEKVLLDAASIAEVVSHHSVAARCWIDLAHFVAYRQERFDEVERWSRLAEAAIARMGGDRELEALRLDRLAMVAWSRGNKQQAVEGYQRAEELLRGSGSHRESTVAAHLDTARMYMLIDQGKTSEAVDIARALVARTEREQGASHPNLVADLDNLAYIEWTAGQVPQARADAERTVSLARMVYGADTSMQVSALGTLARVEEESGEIAAATSHVDRALKLLDLDHRSESSRYAELLNLAGRLARRGGKLDDALARHRAALALYEKLRGPKHYTVGITHQAIGQVQLAARRHAEAVAELERALELVEAGLGPQAYDVGAVLADLGEAQLAAGKDQRARTTLERALSTELASEAKPSDIARTRFLLAQALWRNPADRARARALAEEVRDASAGTDSGQLEAVERWLHSR